MTEPDKLDEIIERAPQLFRSHRVPVYALLGFFGICLIWMIWAAVAREAAVIFGAAEFDVTDATKRNQAAGSWGDSFGGFNAFFAALGALGVAITLFLQFQSLKEQRVEQHVSRFEEKFFRLLDLVRELRSDLRYEQTSAFQQDRPDYALGKELKGHEAIEAAFKEVNYWTFKRNKGKTEFSKRELGTQYDNYVHQRYEQCFAPYFRIIYTILFQIKNDKVLSEQQMAHYGNILRAQLGSFEIGLLAFNATSRHAKDLDKLVTHFHLLKYLPHKRRLPFLKAFDSQAFAARSDYL